MVPDATARELSMHYKVCNYDLVILIEEEKSPATQKACWSLESETDQVASPNLFSSAVL